MYHGRSARRKTTDHHGSVCLIPAIVGALGCASLASPVAAQTVQPGGTVSDQFEEPELPQSQPVAPYRIEIPDADSDAAPQQAFAVSRIVVDGAERFPEIDFAAMTAGFADREVTLGELNGLASRITAALARSGYALAFAIVPEQTVEQGVVRLRIVEGSIDAITIEFEEGSLPVGRARIERAIRQRLEPLIGDSAVRTADLERAVLGVNDLAGVTVSVVISPSATVEGAASLQVLVNTDRYDVLIGADNRLRSEYGREQIYGAFAAHSLLFVGDSLQYSARTALDFDAFHYLSAAYETSIGHSPLRARVHFSTAETEAQSGTLGLLEFEGEERTWGSSLRYPFIRSRARSLWGSLAFDGIDTESRLFDTPVVDENIRTVSANLTYDWASGDGALSLFSATLVQGISGLGASSANNPLRSRSTGKQDATFATFRFYRDQPLPAGLRFRYNGEAQWLISSGGLLAANECTFGGPAIGRAYDAGVLSGEECLFASGELARPTRAGEHVVEPFAFFDWGRAYQRGRLEPGQPRVTDAQSYGFGVRLITRFGLRADVQLAVPAERLFPGDDRDPRLFFTLSFQR